MLKLSKILWLLPLALTASALADRTWNRPGWRMTFDDEFNSTNNSVHTAVNTGKWNIQDGPNSANEEQQWYTPENVYQHNGFLVLKSENRSINGWPYASGKVDSAGRWSPHFGRIDIRAKLPTGKGIWPAHWMLGYRGWPPELDITELVGSNPYADVVSLHYGPLPEWCPDGKPWNCGHTHNTTVWWGIDWTADWHTFSLEWDWYYVKWFIDGAEVFAFYYDIPNEPMFLILNTAVGGQWPGWPDWTTQWPQYHLVDYVRGWARTDGKSIPNGGFEYVEDGAFPDWNTIHDLGNVVTNDSITDARSGARSAKMFGGFDSPTNRSYLVQNLPANEGQMWQASVWAANRRFDALQSNNTARFKLEFYDGFGALQAQHPVTVVTSNTPATYTKFTIRQKAPAWTTHARIVMELNQIDYAGGAALFDDSEMFPVTEQSADSIRQLVNGSFEQGDGESFLNWSIFGPASNVVSETATNNVKDAKRAVEIVSQSDGSSPQAGLFQDIPSRSAEQWTATVWAQNSPENPVLGGNLGILKLEFLNSAGTVIQSNEVVLISSNSPPGVYTNATIQQYAPVDTAYARFVVEHRQVAGGGGALHFDSASLSTGTDLSKLLNSDLDLHDGTNFLGWTAYAIANNTPDTPWNVKPDPYPQNARSGNGAVQMFGHFPGNATANESGLYQDIAASTGQIWQASVWAKNRPDDGVLGGNKAKLKLEFLDANNIVLESDVITVVKSNSPSFYQKYVLRRCAPAWTTKARLVMAFVQVNNANGSANFDDPELTQVTVHDPRPTLNDSFEDDENGAFPNWPTYATSGNIIHETLPTNVHSGASAVQMFGTYQAADNDSGMYQDFPAKELEMWQASIWGKNRAGDPLWTNNTATLKIEYYNSNSVQIATNRLTILNTSSSNTWQQYAIRRRAPYGTTRARMVMEMNQRNFGPGSANFDDAAMVVLTATNAYRPLLNGGFEVGQTNEFGEWIPWAPSGSTVQNVARDPIAGNARTGTQSLQLYGAFSGGTNSSGLYQDIPASAGEVWQASIWARNRPGDLLQGSNTVWFKLEFADYWGNVIQQDRIVAVNSTSSTNYNWFALRNTAPNGAAFARITLQYDQYTNALGAANIDDTELRLVTAQSNSIALNGGVEYRAPGVTDFANWTKYDGGNNNVAIDTNASHAHLGGRAVEMQGTFAPTFNNSGLFQDLPTVEGQAWRASAWAANKPVFGLQGANLAQLKLEFLNSSKQSIYSASLVTTTIASPTNYQRFAIYRQAPAGAYWARIVLEMVQPNQAGGWVNFDDAELALTALTGTQAVNQAFLAGPLEPGQAEPTVFSGRLSIDPSSDLNMVIAGTNAGVGFDQILVASTATLAGIISVEIPTAFSGQSAGSNLFLPRKGDRFEVMRAQKISGTFAGLHSPTGLGNQPAFSVLYTTTNVSLVLDRELDMDSDGLADYWEKDFFGSPNGANAGSDTDQDDVPNRSEMIAGTNPTNSSSFLHLETISTSGGFGELGWESVSGKWYSIWASSNLVNGVFSMISNNIPDTAPLNNLDVGPATNEWQFLRLGVRDPNFE